MTVDFEIPSAKTMSGSGEASVSSTGDQTPSPNPPQKKKRNQAGMPDPNAEVIALSPKTLMATNRFICEICNKGFQRDQNLQLHRRGHNLPWKLRQRSTKEVKKRVYVCPEPTCIHHDPSRALGDLTGIKKHFCRKHGEKKYKCEKCSKNYAVQSDWKAHSKICGTKEYKCDCGTLFSRRDSFITHRAFCDALAVETTKSQPQPPPPPPDNTITDMEEKAEEAAVSPLPQQPSSSHPMPASPTPAVVPSTLPIQNADTKLPDFSTNVPEPSTLAVEESPPAIAPGLSSGCSTSSNCSSGSSTTNSVFASLFASSTVSGSSQSQTPAFSNFIQAFAQPEAPADLAPPSSCIEPISLCLSTSHSPIFAPPAQERMQFPPPPSPQPAMLETSLLHKAIPTQDRIQYAPPPPPQPSMSATALLQKAAAMGATGFGGSLLLGLGLVCSSSPSSSSQPSNLPWNSRQGDMKSTPIPPGLHLALPCDDEGSGLKELMMGSSPAYGPKHPTLDFLGLGMAVGGSPSSNLSAHITSFGGGVDMTAPAPKLPFGSGEFISKDNRRSL